MNGLLRDAVGELLSLDDYFADFDKRFWATQPLGFWKLERQQTFKEPANESWRAFAAGRWEESLRILDGQRGDFADYYRRIGERGFFTRRVRIVEQPITPYLQWELHVLRLRHEHGGLTHVLDHDRVNEFELDGPLPEIYTLGHDVMYEAVYDDDGVLAAARRFTDPTLIDHCQRFIESLFEIGEPLDQFFVREAHVLPASSGGR